MVSIFDQIEQSVGEFNQQHLKEAPIESIRLINAPHPDSEEGQALADRIFRHYRRIGFPHVNFPDQRLRDDFLALQSQNFPIENGELRSNMVGLRIVNQFHPVMESVRCRGYRTAVDVFNDDVLFKKAIRKMLLFSKESGRTVANRIRINLLSYSRVQAVSNFRPGSAKQVYDHFQPTKVLDFSMGWGGRMLAAMAGGYPYAGIDPNLTTCLNNLEIKRKMEALFPGRVFPVRIVHACAEDVLGRGIFPGIDLVFTSPPYFDAEHYEDSPHQSYRRYPTEEIWYEKFLRPCIAGAYHDLVDGGHLVINVNPDMAEKTKKFATNVGFKRIHTWRYLLSLRQQNKKHKPDDPTRGEPVFVFRKGAARKPKGGSILSLLG